MAKGLNIELKPQSSIEREGSRDLLDPVTPPGNVHRSNFFVPELDLHPENVDEGTERMKLVVDQINRYIDNIADDYFQLGLHLCALHKALRKSGLTTEQVKSWYAENINMPYSSAMQCRKVAETYAEQPELIGRYTASGAYLLSSCDTPEERERIWNEARGEKAAPSIRELRETLKRHKEEQSLAIPEPEPEESASDWYYRMDDAQLHESLQQLTTYAEQILQCADPEERAEMRSALTEAVQRFMEQMQEVEEANY